MIRRLSILAALPLYLQALSLPVVLSKHGPVRTESIAIPALDPSSQYSFLYSLSPLRALGPDTRVQLELRQGDRILATKILHAGDPDYYTQIRVPQRGDATLVIHATAASANYELQVNRWPLSPAVRSGPIHRWQDAQSIALGATIFASGDDAEYIPLPATPRRDTVEDPAATDWYRFDFTSDQPKLVFFQVELMDRDQIPVNVSVYRMEAGAPKEYFEGEDPVTMPHEVQALPGNKFTPRILREKGTYYIAVHASHPEYKLRTRVYDPPPYTDPQTAVRTALDYIMAAADSWHANTPRRGGVLDRVSSVHQETSLCVACHTTHWPLRAQLYAARNGYPVVQRQQLQFLIDRFYNNPRPFYGFEDQGAVWARVISAPANVLGRMSHLTDIFEEQISSERRASYHQAIGEYLKLYYADRTTLPPDETNGNTPLVSAHQVAWYAWTDTKDPGLGELIAQGEVKNTIDLCYQTLALADIDRTRYADRIRANAERLLSLQRPDGQWSARFEANQPEVEFQTGHALWALQAAGIPASNPQVAKGLDYLLKRQQPFGGWLDPLQSFENFRTPFRETQMAILALSAYFPKTGRAKGWNAPAIDHLSSDPVEMLQQLDNVWDAQSDAVRKEIEAAARSNDALLRQAAVEALGRLGNRESLYGDLLGDASKLVQRTAAWALRQSYSRHVDSPPDIPSSDLTNALASKDDRTRWGATRVFAAHFSAIAKRPEMAPAIAGLLDDPSEMVRMAAVKGTWQFWFWAADPATKSMIEDRVLAALGEPQSSRVESNLRYAVYNLADENIRYLYNNWVPLLGRAEDRERAIHGRLAIEDRLATKFSAILTNGSSAQKKLLLESLTTFPMRRGDIYDLDADLTKDAPPVYNRIGNDTEQIEFFGKSGDAMARALLPLLDSADVSIRHLAGKASLMVRETRFPEVNRVAGPYGADVKALVAKLRTMPDETEVLAGMQPPPPNTNNGATTTARGPRRSTRKLDEAFFRGYVQPILERRGKDGYACVNCHATHTLFDATWATVRNVVNTDDPEDSLILRKPTSSSDSEGIAGSKTLSHGGGLRFTKDSPEYTTILDWIKGAKE